MPKIARKRDATPPEQPARAAVQSVKKQKLLVLLITSDEALWPQIGADLSAGLVLKQLDSIDELIHSTPAGQAGIVLWDARNHPDPSAVLSSLNAHSSRFAIVALDDATSEGAWTIPIQHRQVVAHVGLPISGSGLTDALDSAHEEVNSRVAMLGDGTSAPTDTASGTARKPWLIPAAVAGIVVIAIVAYFATRTVTPEQKPVVTAASPTSGAPPKGATAPTPAKSSADTDEKVDILMEKAQQAMLDRHFIDPAAGSALSLYREVLVISPSNGEAQQGLQRLSEILIARVQSALDDRKFDVALQSLETARSIDPNDRRLTALDEKIASLRAELGPAQILAALNAQNFDRATQLIDEAARSKTVPAAKLAQLRDEVHRRREEFDVGRLNKLIDLRMQQDHLIEPHNDSAAYYLEQAKQAGASAASLQPQYQDLLRRLALAAKTAVDSRRFSDADKILAEMHNDGALPASLAGLQHDLAVARAQQSPQKSDPQYLELAQQRLAQGKLTEPDNDNALYYVNQLRTADPRSAGLSQVSTAVQSQILDRARAALDAGDADKSQSLAQLAAGLGASPDLDALNERIRQRKSMVGGVQQVSEQTLTRVNKLDLQYPYRALQTNVEGWVEIGFNVLADGSVANVKVLNSTPPNVFDSAASKAVSHLRYKPVLQNGSPVAVGTMVRVVFRVPK
jgi:TonB family protein